MLKRKNGKREKIIFRLMYSKRADKLTLLKFIKIHAYLSVLSAKQALYVHFMTKLYNAQNHYLFCVLYVDCMTLSTFLCHYMLCALEFYMPKFDCKKVGFHKCV